MHRRLIAALSLCVATGAATAADPLDLAPLFAQAPPTAPAPPQPLPTPPAAPPTTTPPGITTPPGTTTPPTLAPVTTNVGAAPQSLASSGAGFTPYMMGDLPSASYIQGMICFQTPVQVNIPPVTVTIPRQVIRNSDGVIIAIIPARTIVAVPGRTVIQESTVCKSVLVPQVGRGAIKIEENESPRPVDRVYVTYDYFNDVTHPFPGVPRSDLHRETYGFELTFLDGDGSVGVRANSLQTTGDSTFANDVFGDLTVITKYALINNRQTGDVLTLGFAVSAPTGPDAILDDGARLNSTLLQPFTGFIYNWDRIYLQNFTSLIVPTDSRDVLLATTSFGVGYWLYRPADTNGWVSYLAPVVEGHGTFGLNHRGLDRSSDSFSGFPDTVVLTSGVHIGLGSRSNLALGVAVPVTGPKIFEVEGIAQLNWRF
jgi:hypothetical protein